MLDASIVRCKLLEKMIVSPSVSLLAVGLASGIFFIIYTGMRKRKTSRDRGTSPKEIVVDDGRCGCCLKPFLVGRGVQCSDCSVRSCRKGCSRWDTTDNAWHCLFCHQRRSWARRNEKWFDTFGGQIDEEEFHRYFGTAKSRVYVAGVENAATSSELAACSQEEKDTMETVRDFVEKIVESLVGNVEETSIDRIYDHPAYDGLVGAYDAQLTEALTRLAVALLRSITNKPSAEPPTMAHAALRELVERAVDEARKLPSLGTSGNSTTNSGSGHQEGRNVVEQSYEDLLATAILNKVIEKFQREQVDGNSNVLLGKPSSRTKYAPSESELGLDEGVEEGSSSLEPLSQDECSSDYSAPRTRHPRNHQDPVSLTIEERIEEVTTTYTSDEDRRVENNVLRSARRVPFPEFGMDIIDPSQESSDESQDELDTTNIHVDHISPIESWEENWLFQKKRTAQNQGDSVAMLVPNSSTDFKALIGDKDAEDTSDLSECSSAQSDEEIEKELMEAINNVVPRSPNGSQSDLQIYSSKRSNGPIEEKLCNGIGDHHEADVKINGYQDKEEVIERKSGLVVEENSKDNNSRTREPEKLTNGGEITEKVDEFGEKNISTTIRLEDTNISGATTQVKNSHDKEQLTNNQNEAELISLSNCAPSGKESSSDEKKTMEGAMNGFTQENHSKIQLESLTFSLEENLSREVPKTPTPSPARVSVTEDGVDVVDKGENPCGTLENVLDSLESAKRKLMNVNEESKATILMQEENSSSLQNGEKNEFHAEEEAQRDSEYTEHYDTATQRHLDSLTRTYISERETDSLESTTAPKTTEKDPPKANDKCREAYAKAEAASLFTSTNKCDTSDDDVQLATPPRPGSIAEREHKKWENAAPIENNPYSEENIQRRLWERQYSRRSSDIPEVQHSELPKSDGAELDVVLRLNQPDIARFGRDYYINESKVPSGDRTRRSTTSLSSRPSSSLSQRSGSTAADQEQQEDTYSKDAGTLCRTSDVKSKVAKWQRNNVETNRPNTPGRTLTNNSCEEQFVPRLDIPLDHQRIWDEQKSVEDILENERKNSKNEINAKLNNQESGYEDLLEKKKSSKTVDNQKQIRRIDLKAYGFENEFRPRVDKAATTASEQRVVNRLDLKSFGYDGGLRRTQSNNHLEKSVNEIDFRPSVVRVTNKSNLTCYSKFIDPENHLDYMEARAAGDCNLVRSESLNKLPEVTCNLLGNMASTKSVPEIPQCDYVDGKEDRAEGGNQCRVEKVVDADVHQEEEVTDVENQVEEASNNVEKKEEEKEVEVEAENQLLDTEPKDQCLTTTSVPCIVEEEQSEDSFTSKEFIDDKVPLPSVRRLAEAFSKQPESTPIPASRSSKLNDVPRERSSTPEIHLVETPKQMHSLTARSLSKQFREGLRQIPNRVSSPPASHVAMEPVTVPEVQQEVVQSNGDKVPNDIDVISPGKLKSNIMFWEELQKRN